MLKPAYTSGAMGILPSFDTIRQKVDVAASAGSVLELDNGWTSAVLPTADGAKGTMQHVALLFASNAGQEATVLMRGVTTALVKSASGTVRSGARLSAKPDGTLSADLSLGERHRAICLETVTGATSGKIGSVWLDGDDGFGTFLEPTQQSFFQKIVQPYIDDEDTQLIRRRQDVHDGAIAYFENSGHGGNHHGNPIGSGVISAH